MTHQMKLNSEPFSQIENGTKTIELRLYDEKRQKIAVGDTLIFTHRSNEKKTITVKVAALHRFDSFSVLYASLPLTKCGYTVESAQTADPKDMAQYYDSEDEKRYGVVGIEFIKLN